MKRGLRLAIAGATGRMGRRLIALATQAPDLQVVAALARPGHLDLGKDAGTLAGVDEIGVRVSAELGLDPKPDVLIDFTSMVGFRQWIGVCEHRLIPILVGSTGLTASDQQLLNQAAHVIPVLQATHTSMGVAVLNAIAAQMASMLKDDFDIEIIETHHRHKKDHPSGTALTLADRVLAARGQTRQDLHLGRNQDDDTRKPGQVGMHCIRMGDVTGTHSVHFASEGERLELTHVATHRDVFARGALRAATWLAAKGAGRYQIEDVLNLGAGVKSQRSAQ